jgi:hypothetical protein
VNVDQLKNYGLHILMVFLAAGAAFFVADKNDTPRAAVTAAIVAGVVAVGHYLADLLAPTFKAVRAAKKREGP